MHREEVHTKRQGALPAVFLLEDGWLNVDKLGLQHILHLALGLVKLLFTLAVEGEVQSDIKHLFARLLELVPQKFNVLVGGVQFWVAHHPPLLAHRTLALHLGNFLLQATQNHGRINGVNVDGNVKNAVKIDDGHEPVFGKLARVGNDKECPRVLAADVDEVGTDLERRRRNDVLEGQLIPIVKVVRDDRH